MTMRVLWIAAGVLIAVVASVVLSFLVPRINSVLAEVLDLFRAAGTRVAASFGLYLTPRIGDFWTRRVAEPRRPVVAEIERVASAIETIGTTQVDRISALNEEVLRRAHALRAIGIATEEGSRIDPSTLAARAQIGSPWAIVLALAIAFAVGGVNAFLLNIFFRETIGSYRLLPYPLPDLQASLVIAVLFFALEVAIGWFIYIGGRKTNAADDPEGALHERSTSEVVMRSFPWLGLAALLLVEVMAYSVLSVRIDMPSKLKMAADSPFVGLAKYFLALFGAAITATLAYVGHLLAKSVFLFRSSAAQRGMLAALKSIHSAGDEVRKTQQAVAAIKAEVEGFQPNLAASYRESLELVRRDSVLSTSIQESIAAANTGPTSEGHPAGRAIRTRTQVIADFLLFAVVLVVLVVVYWLTATLIMGALRRWSPETGALVPTLVAVGVLGAVGVLSFVCRNALISLPYSTSSQTVVPNARGRKNGGYAALAILIVTSAFMGILAAQAQTVGPSVVLNVLLGVVLSSALILLSCFLDSSLVAVWHLVTLVWFALVRVIEALLRLLCVLGEIVIAAIRAILRLLATPGDLIRSLFAPRKGPAIVAAPGA